MKCLAAHPTATIEELQDVLNGTVLGDYQINPKQAYQPKMKTVAPQKPGVQPFTTS